MQHPIYFHQSTLYNYLPFTQNYQYLSSTINDTSSTIQQFNTIFKTSLKNLVANSNSIQLPTLKNLYQQIIIFLKDSLTKVMIEQFQTSHIHNTMIKISLDLSSNLKKLNKIYSQQIQEMIKRSQQFQKVKNDIEDTQMKMIKINQQILLMVQKETVDKFYKLNYKESYQPITNRDQIELQNQLMVLNQKVQYYQQNIQFQGTKTRKLCHILANQLEEIMINTTFVDITGGKKEQGKGRRNSYEPLISSTIEEECIKVQKEGPIHRKQIDQKIQQKKKQIDYLFNKLQYQ